MRVSRLHPRGMRAGWRTLPQAYPSGELVRAFRRGEMTFEEYSRRYLEDLEARWADDPSFGEAVRALARRGDLTLLCYEGPEEPCHRRPLALWLCERVPLLEPGHLA